MGGPQKSRPPKAHHIIPAALMGQFATPETLGQRARERRVWVYERGKEPASRSVETECKETHYFSIKQADGTYSTAYESEVNLKVEVPFNELLPILESPLYVPSLVHASVIFRYVASMFNRSKQRRIASQQNSEEIDAAYKKISSDPGRMRLLTAAYSVKLGRSMPVEMVKEILQHDRSSIRDQSNAFIERMDVMNDGVVEMLAGRPYGLLKAPRDKFLF